MLSNFKNNFNGGTRQNRFRITGSFPTGGGFTDFHIRATTIPNSTLKTVTYDYFGRKYHYPGEREYGTWSFSAWDDIGAKNIWGQLQKWQDFINQHDSNITTGDPKKYKAYNWKIQHLDLNGDVDPLKEWILHGCWPVGIQPVSFNMGNPNTINSFNVIIVFDYIEITGITNEVVFSLPGLGTYYSSGSSQIPQPAPGQYTITTSLVTPFSENSSIVATVPSLIANNIEYGDTVYNANLEPLTDWLDTTCCGFSAAGFTNKLNSYLTSGAGGYNYQAKSIASGYSAYFGLSPKYMTLNTSYTPTSNELQEAIPVESDITTSSTTAYKAFQLCLGMMDTMKIVSPTSNITQFSLPFMEYYFLQYGGDACTWHYKRPDITNATYEAKKVEILQKYQEKYLALSPHVDIVTSRLYAIYSEGFMAEDPSNINLQQSSIKFAEAAAKLGNFSGGSPVSFYICPVVFPGSEYTISGLTEGNWSLPEPTLRANVNALYRLVYSESAMNTYILGPLKGGGSGINRIHMWMNWEYAAYLASLLFTNSPIEDLSNANIYLHRKYINDLFYVTGTHAEIPIQDNTTWQNLTYTRPLTMAAALAKDIEMANSFRSL